LYIYLQHNTSAAHAIIHPLSQHTVVGSAVYQVIKTLKTDEHEKRTRRLNKQNKSLTSATQLPKKALQHQRDNRITTPSEDIANEHLLQTASNPTNEEAGLAKQPHC